VIKARDIVRKIGGDGDLRKIFAEPTLFFLERQSPVSSKYAPAKIFATILA
jgi:hypothetical protein